MTAPAQQVTSRVRRGLVAFGRFWLDFLVGDTPELFVATIVLVALALLLRHERAAAMVVLPGVAALSVLGSAFRGRRRAAKGDGG